MLEVNNYRAALELATPNLQLALLDKEIPQDTNKDPEDLGPQLAEQLCRIQPRIGIVSISSNWGYSTWDNPLFDPSHLSRFGWMDQNGWKPQRGPDTCLQHWGRSAESINQLVTDWIGPWSMDVQETFQRKDLTYQIKTAEGSGNLPPEAK